jgi:hypothetical protein
LKTDPALIDEEADIGPITAARLERALDRVAFIMSRRRDGGAGFLPLYRRIEADIAEQRAVEDALEAARDRARLRRPEKKLTRSTDQMAARSA